MTRNWGKKKNKGNWKTDVAGKNISERDDE